MDIKEMKHMLPRFTAGVLLAVMPISSAAGICAYAGSPEFSRTAQEWETLRDDVLEYGEIEDLVHEYNATVQLNQLDYNEFKRDYGTTKEDVSDRYRELASEINDSISYPDADSPMYVMMMSNIASAEATVKSLEKQADNNMEDSQIIYLNYEMAEKNIAAQAQANMITYYSDLLQLQQAEVALQQAQSALSSLQAKAAAGAVTSVQVLTGQESVLTAERAVSNQKTAIDTVRRKLIVALGWKADANPEIRELPVVDMDRILQMDPETDKAQALENNYTLRVNKKKLENAGSQSNIDNQKKLVADNEIKIASSLVTAYQNVQLAKLSYDQAAADLELTKIDQNTLNLQYQLGNASRRDFENGQYAVQSKELAAKLAELALLQAMENYDWAVKGLASAS